MWKENNWRKLVLLRCLVKLDFFGDNARNSYLIFDAVGRVTTMGVRKGFVIYTPIS